MSQQTAHCAQGRVPVTVESAFALLMSGMFPENSATVMTGTVTSMMVLSAQGMDYVAVETVNAGMDGLGMPVRYGLAQNTPKGQIEEE